MKWPKPKSAETKHAETNRSSSKFQTNRSGLVAADAAVWLPWQPLGNGPKEPLWCRFHQPRCHFSGSLLIGGDPHRKTCRSLGGIPERLDSPCPRNCFHSAARSLWRGETKRWFHGFLAPFSRRTLKPVSDGSYFSIWVKQCHLHPQSSAGGFHQWG